MKAQEATECAPPHVETAPQQFTGNTNSQFYMWESPTPHDEDAFEEDLIASTSESAYH